MPLNFAVIRNLIYKQRGDTDLGKYLMWGMIPVTFSRHGAWKVDSENLIFNGLLTGVIVTLAALNRAVEKLLMGKVSMGIPMVPVEERCPKTGTILTKR